MTTRSEFFFKQVETYEQRVECYRAFIDEWFQIVGARSVRVWKLPGDRLIAHLIPIFDADSFFFLRRPPAAERAPA